MGQSVGDVWYVVSPEGEAVTVTPLPLMEMEHPDVTLDATASAVGPSPTPAATRSETQGPAPASPDIQEIATLENYTASQFYPDTFIVIKDVPVSLLMTRSHREHVNQFTIEPFISSRPFVQPGEVVNVEFPPGQSGQFTMRNVGHLFTGEFIVAENAAEARRLIAERGIQELSLIHDFENGGATPGRVRVQKDILVRVYNVSTEGRGRVSIDPFFRPEEANVREKAITTFEFIPDVAGELPSVTVMRPLSVPSWSSSLDYGRRLGHRMRLLAPVSNGVRLCST